MSIFLISLSKANNFSKVFFKRRWSLFQWKFASLVRHMIEPLYYWSVVELCHITRRNDFYCNVWQLIRKSSIVGHDTVGSTANHKCVTNDDSFKYVISIRLIVIKHLRILWLFHSKSTRKDSCHFDTIVSKKNLEFFF